MQNYTIYENSYTNIIDGEYEGTSNQFRLVIITKVLQHDYHLLTPGHILSKLVLSYNVTQCQCIVCVGVVYEVV